MSMHCAAITLIGLITLGGCTSERTTVPPATKIATVKPATQRAPDDDAARAMRPFLGRWRVDVDSTAEACLALADDRLAALVESIRRNPFTLEITHDRYVSRSVDYIRDDHYEAVGYDDEGAVVIRLVQWNGREPTTAPGSYRSARLLMKDGRLFIGPDDGVTIAFVGIRP